MYFDAPQFIYSKRISIQELKFVFFILLKFVSSSKPCFTSETENIINSVIKDKYLTDSKTEG